MTTLTIRTQPEHDAALARMSETLGIKTASQTLLSSLLSLEEAHKRIRELESELRQTQQQRNTLKRVISNFQAAHSALSECDLNN